MSLFRLAAVCLTCACGAWCQTPTGSIDGKVVDLIGEALTDVTVQAKNTGNGKLYRTTSAAGGVYALKDLPAGTYEVMVSVSGYSGFDQKDVAVAAAKTTAF